MRRLSPTGEMAKHGEIYPQFARRSPLADATDLP
jgi:hypothetical protein